MTTIELQPGRVVGGRYTLSRVLGRGSQGTTWLATNEVGGELALKHVQLRGQANWKAIELFEREAKALEHLEHPGIPHYVDFVIDEALGGLFLAQEYVAGRSLQAMIDAGHRWSEASLRALLTEALDILIYLHGLSPPVVHRDIKPNNLLVRENGRLALIDFGGVMAHAAEPVGGSTVVGTSGYMPAEQLVGRASPSSDLYALGATAVHMLSHRSPSSLQMRRMRLEFQPYVNVGPPMRAFLEKLLEPAEEDRFQSATEAREALTSEAQPAIAGRTQPAIAGRTRRAQPMRSLLVGGSVVLLLGLVGWSSLRASRDPSPGPPRSASTQLADLPIRFEGATVEGVGCVRIEGSVGVLTAEDPGNSGTPRYRGQYALVCVLENRTDKDLMALSAQAQFLDANDELVGGRSWPIWDRKSPLRPGQQDRPQLHMTEFVGIPARIVVRIVEAELVAPQPRPPGKPLELSYEAPLPPGGALRFSDYEVVPVDTRAGRYVSHLRFEIENTGTVPFWKLRFRLDATDAQGKPYRDTGFHQVGSQSSPLRPGHRQVVFFLLRAGMREPKLSLTDVGSLSRSPP